MSTTNADKIDVIYNALKSRYKLDSDKALADFLGVDYRTLAAWKSRGKIAKIDAFIDKCSGINVDWLKTGEGEPFKEWGKGEVAREELLPYNPEDFILVKVHAMTGAGTPRDMISAEAISEIIVPKEFHRPSIMPVQVKGESMQDTIREGAFVGIDTADRTIVSGKIFAIWLPYEGLTIKRLFIDAEKVICRSDNPSFPEFAIPLKELEEDFIQGRVRWVVQML